MKNLKEWLSLSSDVIHTGTLILIMAISAFFVGGLFMVPLGITVGQEPRGVSQTYAEMTVPYHVTDAQNMAINTSKLLEIEKRLDQHRDWIIELQSSVALIKGVGTATGSVIVILAALGLIVKRKP